MKNSYYLLILLLFSACASIDLPPGGEKDTQPPTIVSSIPTSNETLYTGKTIKIEFDEYFSLNDFNNNLIVSPPLTIPPKTRVKGKTLYIDLQEELLPNVTYQFYIGEGIKDLNENNKTDDLRLVFSTGTQIDTNRISGLILDAFTKQTSENIKVLLYLEEKDSQLIKDNPYYITKTKKNGLFQFENITNQSFKIYAIEDKNNNNKLDLNESFATLDTLINYNSEPQTLYISTPSTYESLKLKEISQPVPYQYICIFNQELEGDRPKFISQNPPSYSKNNLLTWHYGYKADTVYLYKQTVGELDSFITLYYKKDTLQINLKTSTSSQKNFVEEIRIEELIPDKPLSINHNYAVKKTNSTKINILDLGDSTNQAISSIAITKANRIDLNTQIKENTSYRIILYEGAVTYLNDVENKTDTFYRTSINPEETGDIELTVSIKDRKEKLGTYYLIIQQKEAPLETIKCNSDTIITLHYLKPGNYQIYVFEDLDNNLRWSAANYYQKKQPEPIWRLDSPIDVRKNWSNKNIELIIK